MATIINFPSFVTGSTTLFNSRTRSSELFTTKSICNNIQFNTVKMTHSMKPILVCDVLDTLVVDPFFTTMHNHFGFNTHQQFLESKTPNVWVDFELGNITEDQLASQFFKSNQKVDLDSFKQFLKSSYQLVDGVSDLLNFIRNSNIPIHLCTNYPKWTHLIEHAIGLSAVYGAHWTFISGEQGIRKPDIKAYQFVSKKAGVDVSNCVLLDDREANCEGALKAGYTGAIQFSNADQAREDLIKVFTRMGAYTSST